MLFDEAFVLSPAQFLPLDQENDKIDAFLVNPLGACFATGEIARRYHKPIILIPMRGRSADIAAYVRSIGEEVVVADDNAELERTILLLRARAVYRETRVLFPTNRGFPPWYSSAAPPTPSIWRGSTASA
jgi:hypothetical protein